MVMRLVALDFFGGGEINKDDTDKKHLCTNRLAKNKIHSLNLFHFHYDSWARY